MSRVNVARKIRDNHQNNNNSKEFENDIQFKQKKNEKTYIIARMDDTFGKKENYHLNQVNIKYPVEVLLEKEKNNIFRIRNYKHSKNRNDPSNFNFLKDQNNENQNDKRKMKLNFKANNNNNNIDLATKYNNKYSNINNINNNKKIESINDISNKTDNICNTNAISNNIFPISINNYFLDCNFLLNMKNNEIENYLEEQWKKLGIKDNYINVFNSYKNNFVNPEEKLDFIISEIENSKKFLEILYKLSNEIEGREKIIKKIKNFLSTLSIKEEIIENKNVMNDFTNLIISYRESSIKVIEYYLLYKEKIIRGNIKGKFDDDFLMKRYGLIKNNSNYLIEMKSDMSFLCNTKIGNCITNKDIFNSFKGDPFLTCLYNIIPVLVDYKQKIKYCHYYIIQESFIEKMNKSIYNSSDIKDNKNKVKTTHINIDTSNQSTITNNNRTLNKNDSDLPKKFSKNIMNRYKHHNFEENKNDVENINDKEIKQKTGNKLQNSYESLKNINSSNESTAQPRSLAIINNNNNENMIIIDNSDNYNISYYTDSLTQFINQYAEYYKSIPLEQKKIFNIQEDPMHYLKHNYYPKIIIYKDINSNEIKGLCIYSVLLSYYEDKPNQIVIEHLSSYNKDGMEKILKKMFEFLKNNNILNNSKKKNNDAIEIYIDLYFYLENEKFMIDTKIRDFIKNELKFRWVKLENISKGIRFQKMKHTINGSSNPSLNNLNEAKENDNEDNEINTDEDKKEDNLCINFAIKNKSIMKFMKKDDADKLTDNNNVNPNDNKNINPFNIIYLINKLFSIEDKKISEHIFNNADNFFVENDKLEIKEILNKKKDNSQIDNSQKDKSQKELFENISLIDSDFKELINVDFEGRNNSEIKFDIKAKMDILPLFDNCISIKYKNYYYNRIESKNIKIFKEKTTNQKFYFITPANNENINLLISTSLSQQFIDKYIMTQDNSNISLKFKEIYNNMDIIETNESNDNCLYIPSFRVNSQIKAYYKKENEENKDKFIINNYNEYCKIQFISEDLIEKNNRNNQMNFYYDKVEEDYMNKKECFIDNSFIIFILNFDIIDNIAVIPLISLFINKNNFISDN
jgi:hypothetical protein